MYCEDKKASIEEIEIHELHVHGKAFKENLEEKEIVPAFESAKSLAAKSLTRMPMGDLTNLPNNSQQFNSLEHGRHQLLGHLEILLAREQEIALKKLETMK